jgi:LAO/AO transport system kinase
MGNLNTKETAEGLIRGILSGNITSLGRAITLIESKLDEHREIAEIIIEKCLPHSGNSVRIGITGIPGAGKSTFIESFGLLQINKGRKTAVLAVDPSSSISKGSILGDKTRMEELGKNPMAFIRPSPSGNVPGGLTSCTAETIILCEAAGYETIIIETVGVGQGETAVHSVSDIFVLILIAGAGDELQGIKRGVMELADLVLINKSDGNNIQNAEITANQVRSALHLFSTPSNSPEVQVITCSALERKNLDIVDDSIFRFIEFQKNSGQLQKKRLENEVNRMEELVKEGLLRKLMENKDIKEKIEKFKSEILNQKITAYGAVRGIIK